MNAVQQYKDSLAKLTKLIFDKKVYKETDREKDIDDEIRTVKNSLVEAASTIQLSGQLLKEIEFEQHGIYNCLVFYI